MRILKPTLQERIAEVASLRESLAFAAAVVRQARERWDIEHQQDLIVLKEYQETLAEAEAALKAATIIAYKETGNKAPAPGVGVREVIVLDYVPTEALDWAIKHSIALSLDKKAFEAIATGGMVPFVTLRVEPQATIAQDLEEVLAAKEV